MWDLPGPGIEPMSPALAGGFLTTVPPGKSPIKVFLTHCPYEKMPNLTHNKINENGNYTQIPFNIYQIGKKRTV